MDDDVTSKMQVCGPEIFAGRAREIVETAFRRWPLKYNSDGGLGQTSSGASPALVEVSFKTLEPPMEQVRALSGEHSALTFTLEFGRPSCGYLARLTYAAGKVSAWAAKLRETKHAAREDQSVAVDECGAEGELSQPAMLRRVAESFLKAAYGGIYCGIFEGVGLKPKERDEILDRFAVCAEIRALLPPEEQLRLDEMAQQHEAYETRLTKRMRAYHASNDALELYADPEVAELLGADDHEALCHFQEAVRKFRGLATAGT